MHGDRGWDYEGRRQPIKQSFIPFT